MRKVFWAGALLALACGGTEQGAVFDEAPDVPVGGSLVTAGAPSSAGDASLGGSETGAAGEPTEAGRAGSPVGGSGGSEAAGSAGMVSSAGEAGSGGAPAAGAGGHSVGGGGQATGGKAGGGAGGNAQGGSAGASGSGPLECPDEMLDCSNASGCESWMGDHDTCGSCEKKCGVTQVCKRGGSPGAWTFGCITG